jgi:hypothetical protein
MKACYGRYRAEGTNCKKRFRTIKTNGSCVAGTAVVQIISEHKVGGGEVAYLSPLVYSSNISMESKCMWVSAKQFDLVESIK